MNLWLNCLMHEWGIIVHGSMAFKIVRSGRSAEVVYRLMPLV